MRRLAAAFLFAIGAGESMADSWTPAASMPLAVKYAGATAPWGATVFVAGGISGTSYLSTFLAYDASSDSWSTLAAMSVTRAGAVVGAIGGTVYVVAGSDGGPGLAANEAYDINSNSWVLRAPMLKPRRWAAGAVLNGKLYVTGGVVSGTLLASVEVYDPLTNAWTTRVPMPTPRFLHSAVAVGGSLYCIGGITALIGGVNNSNVRIIYVSAVEVYDPATNSWTQKSPMPVPRGAAGAASPGNGMIYVAGGIGEGGATPACDRYNPVADRWDARSPFLVPSFPNTGRLGLVVAAPPSGTVIYAIGGESATRASYDIGGNWYTDGTVYSDSERYGRDPGGLSAALSVVPPLLAVGGSGSVFLDFVNTGDATLAGIAGIAGVTAGSGASITAGPASATWFDGTLSPGAWGRFVWSITATAAGLTWFSATAAGTDAEWGTGASAGAWNDVALTTAYPARLVSAVAVGPLPLVPGGNLTVTLTLTNEGGGTLYEAAGTVVVTPAGAPVAIVAGPEPTQAVPSPWLSGTVMLSPLSATTFTWTFSVTGAGYGLFTLHGWGKDPFFGTFTATGMRSTTPSAPAGLATRQGDAAALLTWTPNPWYEGVTTYFVYRSPLPGVTAVPVLLVGTTSDTWFDDSGLINGVTYYYILTAMNGDGIGPPSGEISVTPANIPDAPGEVRVVCVGANPLAINPDRGERMQFLVNVPAGTGTMRILIYSLAGEIVREVLHTPLPPGKWIIDWDGRNSKGRPAASGGYVAVIDMPDGTRKRRNVAVLK